VPSDHLPLEPHRTHEVLNQSRPLENYNPFCSDRALVEALRREGAGWAEARVAAHGERAGSPEVIAWGFQANENLPRLRTHDRFGHRIDEVAFHPAYHSLVGWSMQAEVHSLPWTDDRPGAWVARSALIMLSSQVDAGHICPVSMATACVPTLRSTPELAEVWIPRVTATQYDPRFVPAAEKRSCHIGMAMTEKQGGSDVRANTTRAEPVGTGGPGQPYVIHGHKWFCSAPMCDAFLVLAQAPGGLSCFLLPRYRPDATRNGFFIQRLKDKLGNRSNASSEVEFDGAFAWLVGEEGRGVPTIIDMVNHTRLDCALISTALMRIGVAQAVHHARHRSAFQKKLIDHELMQGVLGQLCVESEAATSLVMRLARSYDRHGESERERLFRRLVTAAAKYWICKRAPSHVGEAMECLGGAGFVEESVMPRVYREAPLNSIWEGCGNVICLDVLRAVRAAPETLDALLEELRLASGGHRVLDGAIREFDAQLARGALATRDARKLTERIALLLQASLLVRHSTAAIADAFCALLDGRGGLAFGALDVDVDYRAVIERSFDEAGGGAPCPAGPLTAQEG
jgi:putative acyl-CoA dehydrogenase